MTVTIRPAGRRLDVIARPFLGSQLTKFHLSHAALGSREDEAFVRHGELRCRLGAGNREEPHCHKGHTQ
jgi:hypothetical protein